MNLVQIQERLKDVPTQALMAYANGMNPQVPPYLALTELNRRKNMQEPMGQAPQGTVKDQIEQQVSAAEMKQQAMEQMQMDAMRQQQMMQMMRQQMPQQAPAQMAYGGIAEVPVPDEVMDYASGGIVAFSNGELVEDVYAQNIPGMQEYIDRQIEKDRARKRQEEVERRDFLERAGVAPVAQPKPAAPQAETRVPRRMPEGAPPRVAPAAEDPERVAEALAILQSERAAAVANNDTELVASLDREIKTMAQRAPGAQMVQTAAQPTAGVPAAAQRVIAQAQQPAGVPAAAAQAVQTAGPDYRKMLAEQAAKEADRTRLTQLEQDPYAKKQPGEVLEQYIKRMEQRTAQEDARFAEMEKERARSAMWRGLMAAGEASRGQRGIGALAAGFGKVAGEEMEAGRGREEARMKARREQQDAIAKMQQEIESARIARARGDVEEERKRLAEADRYRREAMMKGAEQQAADDRSAADRASRERIQAMPDATERLFNQFADAWLKQNPGKNMADAYAAFKAAGMPAQAMRGQMTWDQALDNARAEFKDQNPLVWQAMERKLAAQEGRQPRTLEQAITERARQLMAGPGGAPAAAPTGGTLPPGVKVTRER